MRRSSLSKSTSSLSTSSSTDNTPEKQAKATIVQYIEALEGFAMGLYQEAFAALLRFINRYVLICDNNPAPLQYHSLIKLRRRKNEGNDIINCCKMRLNYRM